MDQLLLIALTQRYSLPSSRLAALLSHVILDKRLQPVIAFFLKYPSKCSYLVVAWLGPREAAAVSSHVLCTPYNHAPVYSIT